MRRRVLVLSGVASASMAGLAAWRLWPMHVPDEAAFRAAYAEPLAPPRGPVAVYHLGHSLIGRDMPAMLAAAAGHEYHSQIGWGTSLKDHWRDEVNGAEENLPPAHRPAFEALDSGEYPVVVLTEMVELRDAVRWHESGRYLADWAARARAANPDARVYLYETWHRLDDPAGWDARIMTDRAALWEAALLRPALGRGQRVHVIPGGQVMAQAVRAAEAGQIPGVAGRKAFFTDEIHFSDLGAWLMAMVHHAVIYGRSPEGLPARLPAADGRLAGVPSGEAALMLQRLVWRVVAGDPLTGVKG